MDAVGTVGSEVRELIRRSRLDTMRDVQEMRQLVHDAVVDYDERSLHGGLPALLDLDETIKSVLDAVAGFGPLPQYLDDPTIREVWINEPSKAFVARGGTAELTFTILRRWTPSTGDPKRSAADPTHAPGTPMPTPGSAARPHLRWLRRGSADWVCQTVVALIAEAETDMNTKGPNVMSP